MVFGLESASYAEGSEFDAFDADLSAGTQVSNVQTMVQHIGEYVAPADGEYFFEDLRSSTSDGVVARTTERSRLTNTRGPGGAVALRRACENGR